MTLLISALAFVLLLTLLIIMHELGHFALARLLKIDVEEFGFGLPPRAITLFVQRGTRFTLNWVPFGGFVRLKGENEVDLEKRSEPGSFAAAPRFHRILVLAGGVAMNFILAFLLLTIGFSVGRWVPNSYTSFDELRVAAERGEIMLEPGVYISEVSPDGPAAEVGILPETAIVSVDGTLVTSPEQVVALQQGKRSVSYVLLEGKSRTERSVDIVLRDGKAGIGLSPFAAKLSAPRRSLADGIRLAGRESAFMTVRTVEGIGSLLRSLVTRGRVPEGIAGVVGIAVLTHSSVQEGFMTYLRLVALLSLSLAILNILPLPALDGGRLLFVLVEMVIRRPLNQQFELVVNAAGFFLLITLIVIITFNDLLQFF